MTPEDPVSRAWEKFYEDAVGALTRQTRNDPLRPVITRHRPLIEAALAASPADGAGVVITEADLYYDGVGPSGGIRTPGDLGGLVRKRLAEQGITT